MRVDCGRFNGAVTEQNLHNCDIDTALDQPGCIAVAKAMERGAGDAGLARGEGEGTAERPAPDRAVAALVGKKPARVPVRRPELAQGIEDRPGQRDDPFFVALADDPQQTIDTVDGPNLEPSSLSGAQPAGVDDS